MTGDLYSLSTLENKTAVDTETFLAKSTRDFGSFCKHNRH